MSRNASFAVFVAVGLLIVGSVHYYIWSRLVSDLRLSPGLHRAFSTLVVLLGASIPLTFYLSRTLPGSLRKVLLLPAYTWMGVLFLVFISLVAGDVVRGVGGIVQRVAADAPPSDPERRTAAARMLAAGVFLFVAPASALGLRSGLGEVLVRSVRVRLARLPKELDGLTIVQLSDVHVGPTIGKDFVQTIVDKVNALAPDVVAITGDLVDGSVRELRELVAPLGALKAKYGVYFVTGNHEYYSGAESWCRELTGLGIRVLRNERVAIGSGSATFDLAGVDDYNADRFGRGHGADLPRALEGRDPSRELVLLAHQPRAVLEAETLGVGLQLSGHTHGGQIWPWNFLVRLQQPVVSGLATFGRTLIYVSNGTGYWGPPMRLAAPAEVTKIVLSPGTA